MLDMGFLPDIRQVLRHLPVKRQTLFFSATMPPPIAQLTREMLKNPFTVNLERKATPAVGITQAVYPVPAEPEGAAAARAPEARRHQERAGLHADQAPRQPPRRDAPEEGRALRADPRQPHPGAAHAGAGGVQGGTSPRPRGDRHRGPRHRRRGPLARHQLRRAERPRGLHPPRRPDGPRRDDRRRVHVRLPRGGDRPARDRAGDRQAPAAHHRAGLRLHEGAGRTLRGSHRRAHRRDPRAKGRGAQAREGEGRAPHRPRGRAAHARAAEAGTAGVHAPGRGPPAQHPRGPCRRGPAGVRPSAGTSRPVAAPSGEPRLGGAGARPGSRPRAAGQPPRAL